MDPAEQRTAAALADEDVLYLRQGEEALNEALEIVESKDGWKLEMAEVTDSTFSRCAVRPNTLSQYLMNSVSPQMNGDVIYSKVLRGNRKVFRLEAELDASPEELHHILFDRVEEMHEWNPNIRRIRVRRTRSPQTRMKTTPVRSCQTCKTGKLGSLVELHLHSFYSS